MTKRKIEIMMAASLIAALALPVVPTLAAGHGNASRASVNAAATAHGEKQGDEGRKRGPDKKQFEGTVVSFTPDASGGALVLRVKGSRDITETVTISNTLTPGAAAALSPNERVHVSVRKVEGAYVATRVVIKNRVFDARKTPKPYKAPKPRKTPEAEETPEATQTSAAIPTSTALPNSATQTAQAGETATPTPQVAATATSTTEDKATSTPKSGDDDKGDKGKDGHGKKGKKGKKRT